MKPIVMNDNSKKKKKEFNDISNLIEKIANKTLGQLEEDGLFVFPEILKESDDITKEQVVIKSVDNRYCSSNVMGFIGLGEEQLIIKSRFSESDSDFFFQYLLEKVLDLPNIFELVTTSNNDNQVFDLLFFMFPYYLKLAMRKGLYKTYIVKHYNNENVRGSIDFSRHFRENTPFVGKFSYNVREFSYDNSLMELIRHTIEFIKSKPHGYEFLQKTKDEVMAIIAATDNYKYYDRDKIIFENISNPLRHAFYYEYRALQRLCIMILRHEKHQMHESNDKIKGILFDGAWLWEEYVNLLIGEKFYHPRNKKSEGKQYLFKEHRVGWIYPDFISKDSSNRIIIDAKYKPFENIHGKDYLQILAYMFRFEAKKGIYIYPEKDNLENPENSELCVETGTTYDEKKGEGIRDDIVKKCSFNIPKKDTYENEYKTFRKKMEESETELHDSIWDNFNIKT
ncbi:MAG: McrC family protein [Lachnospiraceae bacterium]|jgi:5-methylcytosine-specific restriction endonuclease McrBC regulatory subunit McrC|nr:McrC family protein [Lachnospiraceae bacterium]